MSNNENLVAGLDIGSAKTTAVIAEVVGDLPKHPTVNILGVGRRARLACAATLWPTSKSPRAPS